MLSTDEQEVMKVEQFIVASFLLVAVFIQKGTTSSESALENQKRAAAAGNGPVGTRSSFSSDFNSCLFDGWPPNVLAGKVTCSGQQLCYGGHVSAGKEQALFAVCYNTKTLIPEFTGHFLQSGGETFSPPGILTNPVDLDKEWISDTTLGGQVATDEDYRQPQVFPNYSSAFNLVLARGHLTPDGDFSPDADVLSYTTTNCAPQWQPFNGMNWGNLEKGVRNYSKQRKRNLFIFTGTGGRALNAGKEIKLNGRVLTPKYYWKAVCDPQARPSSPGTTGGQSILFVAENKPGDTSTAKVQGSCAAITKPQTEKFGVINCYSLVDAKKLFPDISANLPPFGASCNPDILGNFMNGFLTKVQ